MDIEKLHAMLIDHERLKLKPYRCPAGKLTIGIGRNIEDNGISPAEALFLCDEDIKRCIKELKTFRWFLDLDEVRQAAMIDMNFNLGFPRFKGFRKMIAAIEAGYFDKAADEMLDSTWARQVGRRAQHLAHMMKTGCWYA